MFHKLSKLLLLHCSFLFSLPSITFFFELTNLVFCIFFVRSNCYFFVFHFSSLLPATTKQHMMNTPIPVPNNNPITNPICTCPPFWYVELCIQLCSTIYQIICKLRKPPIVILFAYFLLNHL